jgi:hypothetical protein
MKAQPESQEGPILLRVAQIKRWLALARYDRKHAALRGR